MLLKCEKLCKKKYKKRKVFPAKSSRKLEIVYISCRGLMRTNDLKYVYIHTDWCAFVSS